MKPTLALTALLALSAPALAEEAGMIKTQKGAVSILRGGQTLTASVGMKVDTRDQIRTGADGAVGITLRDATLLSAGPNSTLTLNQYAFDPTTHEGKLDAKLQRGTLAVISGKIAKASPDTVRFSTPTVTLGVRGTSFLIEAEDKGE